MLFWLEGWGFEREGLRCVLGNAGGGWVRCADGEIGCVVGCVEGSGLGASVMGVSVDMMQAW